MLGASLITRGTLGVGMLRFIFELPAVGLAYTPDADPDLNVALLTSLFGLVCAALLVHAGLPLYALSDALLP